MRQFTIKFENGKTINEMFNHGTEAIDYAIEYASYHKLGYNFTLIDSLQEELEKGLDELEKKLIALRSKKWKLQGKNW